MSQAINLDANKREKTGKNAARALRREGKLPAIIYGNKQEGVNITLNLKQLYKEYEKGRFTSKIIDLDVEGTKIKVIARQLQLHPVSDFPVHVDFLRVNEDSKIKVSVPVRFINHEKSPGLKRGGVLNIVRREIELISHPDALPAEFVVDLDGMKIGESIHISKIEIPATAELTIKDRDFTIATIAGRVTKTEDEETTTAVAAEEEEEKDE